VPLTVRTFLDCPTACCFFRKGPDSPEAFLENKPKTSAERRFLPTVPTSTRARVQDSLERRGDKRRDMTLWAFAGGSGALVGAGLCFVWIVLGLFVGVTLGDRHALRPRRAAF